MGDNKEVTPASGFSFLGSPISTAASAVVESENLEDKASPAPAPAPSSGFGFLSTPPPATSSFGFLNAPSESTSASPSPASSSPAPAPAPQEEIKFASASAVGVKKKKKKKSLVGYARDAADEAEAHSPTTERVRASRASPVLESETAVAAAARPVILVPTTEGVVQDEATVTVMTEPPATDGEALKTGFSFMGMFKGKKATESATTAAASTSVAATSPSSLSSPSSSSPPLPKSKAVTRKGESSSEKSTHNELDVCEGKTEELFTLLCNLASSLSAGLENRSMQFTATQTQQMLLEEGIVEAKSLAKKKEAEQQRHAEKEEFEEAEALTEPIAALRSTMDDNAAALLELAKEIASLDKGTETELKAEAEKFRQARGQLAALKGDKKRMMSELELESSRRQMEEETRLETEEERISMEEAHAEREKTGIEGELKTTEAAIEQQTSSVLDQKRDLECDLLGLNEEIDRVEAELRVKMASRDQVQADLSAKEKTIGDVRSKYDRQLQRIKARQEDVDKTCFECKEERDAITAARELHENDTAETRDMQRKLNDWLAGVDSEADVAELFAGVLESYGGEEVECAPSEEGCAASVERAEIAGEMREAGAALEEATKTKEDCQDRMTVLAAEMRDVDEKLPKLEAEKKAHAAARRFKDAAASAAALKTFTSREEEIGLESEILSGNLAGMDEDVDVCRARLAAATKRLNATEKMSDIARLEHLLRRVAVLKKADASVGRVADSSGGLMALALAGPSGAFIAAEMATHEAAAVALRAKHDLSDEEWGAIESKAAEGVAEDVPEIEEDEEEGEEDGDDDNDGEEEEDGQGQETEQAEEGVVAAEDVGADAKEDASTPAPAPETEPEAQVEIESEPTPESEPATKEVEDAVIVNNEEVLAALEEQAVTLEAKIDTLVEEEDYDGADVAQQELDSLRDQLSKL